MSGKKYKGKTCAYCSRKGVSEVREHVVCREFFLEHDRDNLPMVPACKECNTAKSRLEAYALAVFPLGSRHPDSIAYAEKNISRRYRRNTWLRRQIIARETVWEKRGNLLLRTSVIPVDGERIDRLMELIVRGLFMYEFGFALHENWDVQVTMFRPDTEANIIDQTMRLLGPKPITAKRDLGRGTFVYEGRNSSIFRNVSVWQFALFGGVVLADNDVALSRFSAMTTRKDDVHSPLGDDELSS